MFKYLAPTPVQDLEAWFHTILRAALPPEVFIILGPKSSDSAVPGSHVRINYESYYSTDTTTMVKEGFVFTVSYYSNGVSNHNPHHPALKLLELGRRALWQQIPPRPADAFPLQLRGEKIIPPEKGCGCLTAYQQTWRALNEITLTRAIYADPCEGASEPGSVLPAPNDSITPFDDHWYYLLNHDYDPQAPETQGTNQPWVKDTLTGAWVVNPSFVPRLPVRWGNIPVILAPYVKTIALAVGPR
jgi:hypothetical protein